MYAAETGARPAGAKGPFPADVHSAHRTGPPKSASRLLQRGLATLIRAYRFVVSPLLGPACRFYPSCSVYAEQSILTHGALRGGWLAVRRVSRCHPFHPGGFDPVEPARGR